MMISEAKTDGFLGCKVADGGKDKEGRETNINHTYTGTLCLFRGIGV